MADGRPPFEALIAFEAVLRRGSFTDAAREIGVTQSAISYRIRQLENFFGAQLLRRLNPGVEATQAGSLLLSEAREMIDQLSGLRRLIRRGAPRGSLRVGAGAALLGFWLAGRLQDFRANNPDIPLEVVAVDSPAQLRNLDLDLTIRWLPVAEARRSSTQQPLLAETVFPVCAPQLLGRGRKPLSVPELLRLPLLHKNADPEHQGPEWGWQAWFTWLSWPHERLEERRRDLWFGDLGSMTAAAMAGAGLALCRSLVACDSLREGKLVRPLDRTCEMASIKTQVVRWDPRLSGDSRRKRLLAWLLAEAQASAATASADGGVRTRAASRS